MAILSDTTYSRLSKNAEKSYLILLNDSETVKTGNLIALKKTKTKIKTRWETSESTNISPLTHAALIINGKSALISSIRPIERTEYGYMDMDYEIA